MDNKQRIIQELVPGKQLTLAHIIANPDATLYKSVGLPEATHTAIGILTVTPPETAIIIADVAIKAAGVIVSSVDKSTGSLIVTGTVSQVESALTAVIDFLAGMLHFEVCRLTKT